MARTRCIRVKDKRVKFVRSNPEKEICDALYKWKAEYTYEKVKINYEQPREYTADFVVRKKDDTYMFIEVKGHLRPGDTKKYLDMLNSNPSLDFRFIFQNANKKLRKGAKSNYGDWANRNGIKWADKELPKKWMDEML